MNIPQTAHCRLCADLKSHNKLINLETDEEKCRDIVQKLDRVNAKTDFNGNALPKTVCFVCIDSLERAYEFVTAVARAQEALDGIILSQHVKKESSEADSVDFGYEEVEVKYENDIEPKIKIEEIIEETSEELVPASESTASKGKKKRSLSFFLDSVPLAQLKQTWSDYSWLQGTPITIEELTCPLCKKVYKYPNSLRNHMKLHTIDCKRKYTCDRCGKIFYNKRRLTSHILSHDKIRPTIICRICNKSFLYPNMLRRHVEIHSGVKPFSCEQCGRCFRLQYQLNAHKIIHTDSMPYVCSYCSKAFRFKQILKNHERQHTGAKPYSCQNCGRVFTSWPNYNKHMKRRHGTDTSKKKITPDGVFPVNPETGQIIQVEDLVGTEEWKTRIMVPTKRGRKKVIKQENV